MPYMNREASNQPPVYQVLHCLSIFTISNDCKFETKPLNRLNVQLKRSFVACKWHKSLFCSMIIKYIQVLSCVVGKRLVFLSNQFVSTHARPLNPSPADPEYTLPLQTV